MEKCNSTPQSKSRRHSSSNNNNNKQLQVAQQANMKHRQVSELCYCCCCSYSCCQPAISQQISCKSAPKSNDNIKRNQRRKVSKPNNNKCREDPENCAKCQLIARWTYAQSKLADQNVDNKPKIIAEKQPSSEEPVEAKQQIERDADEVSSLTDTDQEQADKWSLSSCSKPESEHLPVPEWPTQKTTTEQTDAGSKSRPLRGRRRAPQPPVEGSMRQSKEEACGEQQVVGAGSKLLSEQEVQSIEHFLRSHKSSIYVCGCMANLYLTGTRLVDNGRCSAPTQEGWQLSKTGIPVLTFDSGLAKNRDKRRLSINLTERGSGFVLWSDIIDHLSNYRAFRDSNGSNDDEKADSSQDTFHVMYLSSNHRIMVGLSFDDAICARLFLRQVELVTSDPSNISLTGPKLVAQRLGGKLSALLKSTSSRHPQVSSTFQDDNNNINHQSDLFSSDDHSSEVEAGRKQVSSRRKLHRRSLRADSSTWSTLKRAIKFGRQRELLEAASDAQQASLAAFLPKPLAALASAGKAFRAGKRMPRKCDISAPCLFQHVTRVDHSSLARLYSRSLVTPSALVTPTPFKPDAGHKKSMISAEASSEGNSSTSSCYSSASMSPASSECGALSRPPRPLPPRVPQRSATAVGDSELGGSNKIQQIIRELQAQSSAELVEAKRRLMSDIADQVLARNSLAVSHL